MWRNLIQASRRTFSGIAATTTRSFVGKSSTSAASAAAAAPKPALPTVATKSPGLIRRTMTTISDSAAAFEQSYSRSLQLLHWGMAAGMVTCVATVKMAQNTDDKKLKGKLMLIHKSTALIVAALLLPRIGVRAAAKIPPAVPGHFMEQVASKISHSLMYILMIGMPATGITMGYFGGKGLPFYGITHIPGAEEPNKSVAKQAFKMHKWLGTVTEVLIPLHTGAVGFHLLRGQNLFRRMGFGFSSGLSKA